MSAATQDDIEKVRQAIMRFRELLTLMGHKVADGERAYAGLFDAPPLGTMTASKEKDRQWELAAYLVHDTTALNKAVLQARFDARDMERAFEELYDILATMPTEGQG
jgi:hypothetical protein